MIFPLSTWPQSRKALAEWITDELNLLHDVFRVIAQEYWIAADEILPLLDGLDEVNAQHRPACVDAINAFRKSHGFLPGTDGPQAMDREAAARTCGYLRGIGGRVFGAR